MYNICLAIDYTKRNYRCWSTPLLKGIVECTKGMISKDFIPLSIKTVFKGGRKINPDLEWIIITVLVMTTFWNGFHLMKNLIVLWDYYYSSGMGASGIIMCSVEEERKKHWWQYSFPVDNIFKSYWSRDAA